ncbi:hypothetical protein AC86_4251 [Escherichia coli 3-073-06_S4_C1]|nr:hypothetical protein AC86_4251 [Escherichia coli 3-073-06_S4_C1]
MKRCVKLLILCVKGPQPEMSLLQGSTTIGVSFYYLDSIQQVIVKSTAKREKR